MKKIAIVLMAVLAMWSCGLYAQTNTNPVTKNIELNSRFNEIKSSTGIIVKYNIISDKEKAHATISADSNIIDYISVAVKDGTLKINFKNLDKSNNNNNAIKSPTIYVYAPVVNNISVSSGSVITVENDIDINGIMNLRASSGGQIKIKDMKCNSVNTSLSSGSIVTINNISAENLNVKNSSGSQTRINEISSPAINIGTSSGSVVNVDDVSSKHINVDASSASVINMSGKAENIRIDASSASRVNTSKLSCQIANVTASSTASVDVKAQNTTQSTSSYARIKNH